MKDKKRLAFTMKLDPGQKEAYIKRHDEIWPELKKLLKDSGVCEYSIFLDEEIRNALCLSKSFGREWVTRSGEPSHRSKMVGFYGRYYGNESRQFPGFPPFKRSFLYEMIRYGFQFAVAL